jgi:hypothetical protein
MSNINHTITNNEVLLLQIARLLEFLEANSISGGYFIPVSSADADAPNNSIYFSTDANKLAYKDSLGSVNDLY